MLWFLWEKCPKGVLILTSPHEQNGTMTTLNPDPSAFLTHTHTSSGGEGGRERMCVPAIPQDHCKSCNYFCQSQVTEVRISVPSVICVNGERTWEKTVFSAMWSRMSMLCVKSSQQNVSPVEPPWQLNTGLHAEVEILRKSERISQTPSTHRAAVKQRTVSQRVKWATYRLSWYEAPSSPSELMV